jgi:hypothetical protein
MKMMGQYEQGRVDISEDLREVRLRARSCKPPGRVPSTFNVRINCGRNSNTLTQTLSSFRPSLAHAAATYDR